MFSYSLHKITTNTDINVWCKISRYIIKVDIFFQRYDTIGYIDIENDISIISLYQVIRAEAKPPFGNERDKYNAKCTNHKLAYTDMVNIVVNTLVTCIWRLYEKPVNNIQRSVPFNTDCSKACQMMQKIYTLHTFTVSSNDIYKASQKKTSH